MQGGYNKSTPSFLACRTIEGQQAAFLLPKAVDDEIDRLSREFFWGYDRDHRKMFLNWNKLCQPKNWGGIGIKEVLSWNKACFLKVLWQIAVHHDSLWVNWLHEYTLKGVSIWDTQPISTSSCAWKKLLNLRDEFVARCGGKHETAMKLTSWNISNKFCIARAYEFMKDQTNDFEWARTIWESASIPKTRIVLWFAPQNGLPTVDKLMGRGWQFAC